MSCSIRRSASDLLKKDFETMSGARFWVNSVALYEGAERVLKAIEMKVGRSHSQGG